jgi:hypothetical protein
MNKNSNIARQNRLAAMRIAELNATDKEDLIACVSDMQRTASLEKDEAVAVANAIRAKYLPNLAKQAGVVLSELNLEDGIETVDFANDESDDEEIEFHHFQDEEGDEDETEEFDELEDNDEVEDSDDVATFEIEVPADMVDAAQKAVQDALDNLLGGDDDSEDDMDMEDESDEDSDDESDEDYDDSEEEMDSEDDEVFMKNSNEVRKMTRQALAERKAQREALLRRAEREEILKKFASEEETYPASASFKYNEDLVNMQGEVDYPSMSLDNDGSNSLKEENPTWAEQRVPTVNPGSLQFPDVTKPSKFDGAGDGSLEYTVDWDSLENPSEGLDADMFEVPTQMPSMPHKTTKTVAAAREEESEVQCTTCGSTQRMSEAAMNDEKTRCANDDCPSNKKDAEDEDKNEREADANVPTNPQGDVNLGDVNNLSTSLKTVETVGKGLTDGVKQIKSQSVDSARIKAAYSCSSKLVLAGIITSDEVDSYAEQMLNDNLKVDSMIRQTKLLLKSAQSSTERVAAAAAERMGSVRTASNLGVSTAPAFSGGHTANGAALDIQSALKGTWTMPNIED